MPAEPIHFEDLLRCNIIDTYSIGLKDADLERIIRYENNNQHDMPVSIQSKNFKFSFYCDDFECAINGERISADIKEKDYTKIVCLTVDDVLLKAGEQIEISIKCIWKRFSVFLDFCYLFFSYPDASKYRVIINNISIKENPHFILINDAIAQETTDYVLTQNSIIFNESEIDFNKTICVRIVSLPTLKELPLVSYFSKGAKPIFQNYIIILIQHLLADFIHLAEAFVNSGADKDHIFIIGIPYSTKDRTINYLNLLGFNNIESPRNYPFDDKVKNVLEKAIALSGQLNKKIIIVEDGGYAVPLFHTLFREHEEKFVGAVEQTANGIWRDQELKDEIGEALSFPIINVAESQIKCRLESPLIGKAVSRNVEKLIGRQFIGIGGKKIGIVGYGSTGSMIAKMLKNIGAVVNIYDSDEIRKNEATENGYTIAKSPSELVQDCDVIIEASGNVWCGSDELLSIKHGSYYLSASSKRLGINYSEFEKLLKSDSKVNLPSIGARYTLHNDHCITLLADGYPINFFLGESVPDKAISFILALLYKSAEFIAIRADLPKDIVDMNEKQDKFGLKALQESIAQMHSRLN